MSTSIGSSQSFSSIDSVVVSTAGFGVVNVEECTTSDVVDATVVFFVELVAMVSAYLYTFVRN